MENSIWVIFVLELPMKFDRVKALVAKSASSLCRWSCTSDARCKSVDQINVGYDLAASEREKGANTEHRTKRQSVKIDKSVRIVCRRRCLYMNRMGWSLAAVVILAAGKRSTIRDAKSFTK